MYVFDMNSLILFAMIPVIFVLLPVLAQEGRTLREMMREFFPDPTPHDTLVSPEVDADGKVTFRLYAPEAKKVTVDTEGAEGIPGITFEQAMRRMKNIPLIRADNGVWSVTVGPFPPGVNRYSYKVDGLTLADPRNSASSESVTFVHSLYEIPGADFLSIKEEAPHGAVQEVMYKSKSLNTIRRMHVYTPPGYGIDDKKYPVFYLIHGGGDSDASWSTVGRAGIILDNLISEGKAKPMLIVMPAGHLTKNFVFSQRSVDSMFRQSELFCEDLINDIIPHMEKHYRIMTGPRHRAVAGLSMGGLHTLYAAIAHPETFGYAGVFSSGFFGENGVENFEKEHADWLENPAKKNIKLFWFATGKGDILVGGNTRSTVDMLKRYGFTPEYTESEGFHDWNNWRMYLYTFVQRLFT